MRRLADYVIERVFDAGVKHIYMVTGRGILYLSDAVARHEGMKGVCVHHEQSASYAAYAYAKYSNNYGACLVSTGCASTNTITGVLCAWQNNVPCIFISGQNTLGETSRYTGLPIRTYGSQEADIISIVEPITKYAVMITDANDICYELEKALYLSMTGRKGPVWLDIPIDIQNARVDVNNLRHFIPESEDDYGEKKLEDDVSYVVDKLSTSKRPVVLIGEGVRLAGAVPQLSELLKKHPIPLVYSPSAVDIIGSGESDNSIGAVGSLGGSRAANFTLQNADYILAIGSRLSTVLVGQPYDKFAREAEITVVDIDAVEHKKNIINIEKLIISDAKIFLEKINEQNWMNTNLTWIDKCIHWKKIFPKCDPSYRDKDRVDLYYLGEALSKLLDNDAVVLTDAGFEELIIPSSVDFKGKQRCIHPAEQGAMGMALPASMGAYDSSGCQVVSINGDGSIMMNIQELQTIRYNNYPVKIIICNNNCYAVIRKRQKDLFRTRIIGTDATNGVACPDFRKVAETFDIPYMNIEGSKELEKGLANLLGMDGPVICEINCIEDQEYLHNSYTIGKDRKIVRRSLEDQSPFIDRELFEKEMIIPPID